MRLSYSGHNNHRKMLNFRTSRTLLTISAVYVLWCFGNPHHAVVGSGFHCQCVPPRSCADNRDRDVNGRGVLDVRSHKNKCSNYFEVCCENIIVSRRKNFSDASKVRCGTRRTVEDIVGPRILAENSETAQFGELPWTVLVWRQDEETDRMIFICGGSLIHPQVVLTAAHCISEIEEDVELRIRAGEWKVRTENEALPHQDIAVKEIVEHPRYEEGILWNDIALLFLTDSVHDTDNIGFVCLPKARTKLSSIQSSVNCLASGWGASSFKKSSSTTYHTNAQKKVNVPIVPRRKCMAALRQTKLGPRFKLHKSFLCAGGKKNSDTCKGDGGGPLVCPIGNESKMRYVQFGVVSWGIGCGKGQTPGVYTNVVQFRNWIDDELLKRRLKSNYYEY